MTKFNIHSRRKTQKTRNRKDLSDKWHQQEPTANITSDKILNNFPLRLRKGNNDSTATSFQYCTGRVGERAMDGRGTRMNGGLQSVYHC